MVATCWLMADGLPQVLYPGKSLLNASERKQHALQSEAQENSTLASKYLVGKHFTQILASADVRALAVCLRVNPGSVLK